MHNYHDISLGVRIAHTLWVAFMLGTIIALLVFGWQ